MVKSPFEAAGRRAARWVGLLAAVFAFGLAFSPTDAASDSSNSAPLVTFKTAEFYEDGFYANGAALPAGRHLHIYLNETHIADVTSAADGHWSLTVKRGLQPGHYNLRADLVGASEKVTARAEVSFDVPLLTISAAPMPLHAGAPQANVPSMAAGPSSLAMRQRAKAPLPAKSTLNDAVVPSIGGVTVTNGESLWRISRKIFGHGTSYRLIYEANASQIRNPDLIYPGQVLVVPGSPSGVLQATLASLRGVVDSIPLASHRAVYDLTLLKTVDTKTLGARGRIALDFSGSACDGYVQNFRQLTELQPAEGSTRISDMHSATFEDGLGKGFSFKMETMVDDEQSDQVDGRAERLGRGVIGVDLVKPKPEQVAFGRDVLFPTEHIKYILAAAEAGENALEVRVYDGSDSGDKIYDTTTFIGRPIDAPATEAATQIPQLEHMRRWPVTISYFDDGRKDEAPNYTLSFDLYANGISRALRIDYGDFVLAGEMTSLKLLPTPPCTK